MSTGTDEKKKEKYDHRIKLLLIGDSGKAMNIIIRPIVTYALIIGVGKSGLFLRYCNDSFSSSFDPTIGIEFNTKIAPCGDLKVKLQIWDTGGQERFRTIIPSYFRGAMGIFLVYDVTNEESFTNVRKWMEIITQHSAENVNRILIGNKCDADPTERVSYLQFLFCF